MRCLSKVDLIFFLAVDTIWWKLNSLLVMDSRDVSEVQSNIVFEGMLIYGVYC